MGTKTRSPATADGMAVVELGVFGWTELVGMREEYNDKGTPPWRIGVIKKDGHYGIVFEPHKGSLDGFKVLAIDLGEASAIIPTFRTISCFAESGIKARRLLWLAFCRVSRVEGRDWLNQVECGLRRHATAHSKQAIEMLVGCAEKAIATGRPLTCPEVLGDLLNEEPS